MSRAFAIFHVVLPLKPRVMSGLGIMKTITVAAKDAVEEDKRAIVGIGGSLFFFQALFLKHALPGHLDFSFPQFEQCVLLRAACSLMVCSLVVGGLPGWKGEGWSLHQNHCLCLCYPAVVVSYCQHCAEFVPVFAA